MDIRRCSAGRLDSKEVAGRVAERPCGDSVGHGPVGRHALERQPLHHVCHRRVVAVQKLRCETERIGEHEVLAADSTEPDAVVAAPPDTMLFDLVSALM
jgi:hypothetical protein